MVLRSTLACLAVSALSIGCGDDTRVGAGGSPGGGGSDAMSVAASTSSDAASQGATSTATSVGASASTGEPGLCAWFGADPGGLVATGAAVGDVIENVSGLIDQCGVAHSLWDFAGGYRILSITTGW